MDVVVFVSFQPKVHELHIGTAARMRPDAATQWVPGDIVHVLPMRQMVKPSPTTLAPNGTGPGRLRMIRITGAPGTLKKIRARLTAKFSPSEAHTHGESFRIVGRTKWKAALADMREQLPAKFREMRESGWTTITWEQAKSIWRKEDGSRVSDADLV